MTIEKLNQRAEKGYRMPETSAVLSSASIQAGSSQPLTKGETVPSKRSGQIRRTVES